MEMSEAAEAVSEEFLGIVRDAVGGNKFMASMVNSFFEPLLDQVGQATQAMDTFGGDATPGFCFGEFELQEFTQDDAGVLYAESLCGTLPLSSDSGWGFMSASVNVPQGFCGFAEPQTLSICLAYSICGKTSLPTLAVAMDGSSASCIMTTASGGLLSPIGKLLERAVPYISTGFSFHNMFEVPLSLYTGDNAIYGVITNPSFFMSAAIELDTAFLLGENVAAKFGNIIQVSSEGTVGYTLRIEDAGRLVPAGEDAFDKVEALLEVRFSFNHTASRTR